MRLFITLFYSLLLFCTIFSCRDESSSIGSKWVESSFINVVTDTCMVTLSTLLADSLATSGDTICQIGRFKDALYGEIKTSFYAEYQVPSHSLNETTDYQFDSITFNGILPGIIWGIRWSIIVLTYIVYRKDSLWKITVTCLIRPTLAIIRIIILVLSLYVLHPAIGTSCMKCACLTNGERSGLI